MPTATSTDTNAPNKKIIAVVMKLPPSRTQREVDTGAEN